MFCCSENWPYIPHLTIVKTDTDEQARRATTLARERWRQFEGKRQVHLDELMFVRETDGQWQDLAPLPLGRGQLSSSPESQIPPQTTARNPLKPLTRRAFSASEVHVLSVRCHVHRQDYHGFTG